MHKTEGHYTVFYVLRLLYHLIFAEFTVVFGLGGDFCEVLRQTINSDYNFYYWLMYWLFSWLLFWSVAPDEFVKPPNYSFILIL